MQTWMRWVGLACVGVCAFSAARGDDQPSTQKAAENLPKVAGRPVLDLPMDDAVVKLAGGKAISLAEGGPPEASLLVPMETDESARRADLIAVQEGKAIRLYEAAGLGQRWATDLGDGDATVLLGYTSDKLVLVKRQNIIGMDLKTGEIRFEIALKMDATEINKHMNETVQLQNVVNQRLRQNPSVQIKWDAFPLASDGEFLLPLPNSGALVSIDAEVSRSMWTGQRLDGAPAFNSVRLFGDRIAVVMGSRFDCYDATTGKLVKSQQLPSGSAQVMVWNGKSIAVEVDAIDMNNIDAPWTGAATFVLIEAATGKQFAMLNVQEHMMWRWLDADGILTCVTAEGVSAFDLTGDSRKPLWRREDVLAIAPTAVAMGAGGVSLINGKGELVCLSRKKGENLFPPQKATDEGADIKLPKLIADGDTVIVQSSKGVAAYRTKDGTLAWKGQTHEPPPPLAASQMTQDRIVVLGYGAEGNTQRAVELFTFKRAADKLAAPGDPMGELEKQIRRSSKADDLTGPVIQRWQVVNGAICLDINGSVIVYRSKEPAK